jgi:hypothetical protein
MSGYSVGRNDGYSCYVHLLVLLLMDYNVLIEHVDSHCVQYTALENIITMRLRPQFANAACPVIAFPKMRVWISCVPEL